MDALNYVFPNDQLLHWGLMIVIYPYITGIVAGAFIVSALSHLFHIPSLRPISRFALIFAFSWLLFVAAPLLMHLGHPERSFWMLLTPNFSGPSMMAGFGYIYLAYMLLLLFEILYIYRYDLTLLKEHSKGFKKKLYHLLTLGIDDRSIEAREIDRKAALVLSAIGIPLACMLHGYVGFIFGGVKAVEWWFTPLMPIIFLLSASVSGIAGITLFYILIKKYTARMQDIETATLKTLVKLLWAFFIFDFLFEMLDLSVHAYGGTAGWHHVNTALQGPLFKSFWIFQVLIFSLVPLILLGWLSLAHVKRKILILGASIGSIMLLIQVMLMRWNVVIGGQLMSKSERGFASFQPAWFEKEGILTMIILLTAPMVMLWLLSKIFPLWEKEDSAVTS